MIAAGFEGGTPKRAPMPTISTASLTGQADPIAINDPIAVAMDLSGIEDTSEVNLGAAVLATPRKRVTFEELVSEDEIDVPDFMK